MADKSVIAGKWYVIDRFDEDPKAFLAGPFDTRAQAEKERRALNIADDCYLARPGPAHVGFPPLGITLVPSKTSEPT